MLSKLLNGLLKEARYELMQLGRVTDPSDIKAQFQRYARTIEIIQSLPKLVMDDGEEHHHITNLAKKGIEEMEKEVFMGS